MCRRSPRRTLVSCLYLSRGRSSATRWHWRCTERARSSPAFARAPRTVVVRSTCRSAGRPHCRGDQFDARRPMTRWLADRPRSAQDRRSRPPRTQTRRCTARRRPKSRRPIRSRH
eukprot:4855896-Prymnesium_polylepis.2